MKLKEFYEMVIEKGMQEDQRPKKVVEGELKKAKQALKEAKGLEKEAFDMASLTNPYPDTSILTGSGKEEVKNVMVGIDIDVAEIILADRLRDKGMDIHLVVSHHPSGKALARLPKVMEIQPTLWEKYGLSQGIAESLMKPRIDEVSRGLSPANHTRAVDAARLLGIPFMCMHTAADNCVAHFLQKRFDKEKPKKLKNVLNSLKEIPEYKSATKLGAGPFILMAKEDAKLRKKYPDSYQEETPAGKIFVDMTGGTSGPDKVFSRLSQSGVGTLVGMHCKESSYKVAKSEFISYIIAGHIASDSLGMNLLFDTIEKKEKLNFIECSGFQRVKRK